MRLRAAVFPAVAILLALLPVAAGRAAEPGTEAAPFLTTEVGAAAAAMGGAYTAVADGAAGIHWNPAALALLDRGEIAALHLETPFGENYEYLGWAHPVGARFGIGLSAVYLWATDAVRDEFDTLGEFTNSDLAVTAAAGGRLTDSLSVGLSMKYVRERLFVYNADAVALDAAALWRSGPWSLGAAVRNYGEEMRFLVARDPLPLRLALGGAWASGRWRLAADATLASQTEPGFALGAECAVLPSLLLRGGYRLNYDGRGADGLAAGLAFRIDDLSARYAYAPSGGAGGSHRIEVAYALGARGAAAPPAPPAGRMRRRLIPRLPIFRDLGLRGTYTVAHRATVVSNGGIINRIPGGANFVEYAAVGGTPTLDVALSASLTHDKWDRFEPRRVQVTASTDTLEVVAGHLLTGMTDYTLTPQQIIGGEARLRLAGAAPAAIPAPPGGAIRGRRARGGFSVGKWYRERGIDRRTVEAEVRALGGQTARAVNVGDRIPFQNGDFATYGVFEEFTYGVAATASLHPLVDLTTRLVHVEDAPGSLHDFGVTRPKASTTASLGALWTAPSGATDLSGEYAWSVYDPDRFLAGGEKNDWAAYLRWQRRFASRVGRRIEVTAERIGDEYEALGSPSTKTTKDRQGIRGFLEWPFALGSADGFALRLDGEQRDNNLNHRLLITTRTRDGRASLGWSNPAKGWSLRTGVQSRTDISDATDDTRGGTLRVNTRNDAVRVDLRAPAAPFATLDVGYSRSIFDNRTVLASASTPSKFATTVWRAGVVSVPGKFGGADFGVSWNSIRSHFTGTSVTRTVTDIWNARLGYALSQALRCNAFATWQTMDGPTQGQEREEAGGNVRYVISPERALLVEFRRFRDVYDPAYPDLQHEGYALETRLTTVF